MKKCQFTRAGKAIKEISTGKITGYKHVNEAKRESAKLQRANGGIGCGVLRVVPHIKVTV